jgi:hypothetical protein
MAVESAMFCSLVFAPPMFDRRARFRPSTSVETRRNRLVQTDTVNPADAADCSVCIPPAVMSFPRE